MTSQPIRIAQVVGYMDGGGVEQVVMNYYRHIDRSRVQFDFIVCEGSKLIPSDEIQGLGGRVFMVSSYANVVAFMRQLRQLIHAERWKIVHSHINALSVFPLYAAKLENVPVRIAHSHSTSGKGELFKNLAKFLLKTQANRFPTHRFACGQYAGEWLFGKNEHFEIIRNAIELRRFAFTPSARAEVRKELGIEENQFVVGHVGRFMAQKNHQFLIEVFRRVVELRDDALLLLVGEGELKNEIAQLVREAGLANRVVFLGQRSDVERIYQAFDVFCLPSLYEGLCLVGIEAQSNGLACIFSDSITREVDVTKSTRFLPINDSEPWAQAICQVSPGYRNAVNPIDFSAYEINSAAEALCCRYIELAQSA